MDNPYPNNPEIPEFFRQSIPSPTPTPSDAFLRAMQTAATTPSYHPTEPPEKSPTVKLQDCVTTGRKLLENKNPTKDSILAWVRRVRTALFLIFGNDAAIVKDLNMLAKEAQSKGLSRDQLAQRLMDVESLAGHLSRLGSFPLACPVSQPSRTPATKDVFIIHGHDELNTHRLSQLLRENFGLNPIAMLAKPGMSRPLTDKFEDEAQNCSFAFALFTPDDAVVKANESYNQARPNVIYEIGWFIGRLGRDRVTIILKKGTEIHSDLDGVSRIQFAENVTDTFLEIQKELKAAKIVP